MLIASSKERVNLDNTGGREHFSEEAVFKLAQKSELAGGQPEQGKALGKGRAWSLLGAASIPG